MITYQEMKERYAEDAETTQNAIDEIKIMGSSSESTKPESLIKDMMEYGFIVNDKPVSMEEALEIGRSIGGKKAVYLLEAISCDLSRFLNYDNPIKPNTKIHIPLSKIPKETIDALYINHGVPKIDSVILAEKTAGKHSHYFKDVSDLDEIDVYRVCDLFDVNDTSGAIQHALKKLLCSGQRGVKDYRKDLEEARDSIQRKLDIMAEDGE